MGNCLNPQTVPKKPSFEDAFTADPAAVDALVEGTAAQIARERGERFRRDFIPLYKSLLGMVGERETDRIVTMINGVFPTDCEAFILKLAAVVKNVFERDLDVRLERSKNNVFVVFFRMNTIGGGSAAKTFSTCVRHDCPEETRKATEENIKKAVAAHRACSLRNRIPSQICSSRAWSSVGRDDVCVCGLSRPSGLVELLGGSCPLMTRNATFAGGTRCVSSRGGRYGSDETPSCVKWRRSEGRGRSTHLSRGVRSGGRRPTHVTVYKNDVRLFLSGRSDRCGVETALHGIVHMCVKTRRKKDTWTAWSTLTNTDVPGTR